MLFLPPCPCTQDYVLVIDADMIMRMPFTAEVGAALLVVVGWRFVAAAAASRPEQHGVLAATAAAGSQRSCPPSPSHAPIGLLLLPIPPPPPPQTVGAKPGLACAAYFGYMKGVKNALAMKHVPYVAPRNDTKAGAGAAGCGW